MPTPDIAANVERMDEIVRYHVDEKAFMGTVLASRDGQIVLDNAYGFANLEWQIPHTTDSKFRIGSISKQFSAAVVLMLQDRGDLNVDDPVKNYMKDAPEAWDQITIYNLLTHTSGIPSFTSSPDYESIKGTAATPEAIVARFRDQPLDFAPGSQFSYSNSGYVLLGHLIDKVVGGTYREFAQDHIFAPLGMKDSGFDSSEKILPHRSAGYSPGPKGWMNAGYIDMTVPYAAGDLYSTTHDLLKWQEGLFGGKVLSPASLKKMTAVFKEPYGCGLFIHTAHGHLSYGHGGGIEGFNTQLDYYPDTKLVIAVLANLNGMAPMSIADKLAAVAFGKTVVLPSERKIASVDPAMFDLLTGRYELLEGFTLTVTHEEDRLFAQATSQEKFEIFPESLHEYFYKVVDAQISFLVDAQGHATSIVLHQNGQDMPGKRLDEAERS